MLRMIRVSKPLPADLTLSELLELTNDQNLFIGFERKQGEVRGIIIEIVVESELDLPSLDK